MISQETVKKLNDYPAFADFKKELLSTMQKLQTVDDLVLMSNQEAGETAKVRALTIQVLYALLQPFIENTERKGPSEEDMKKARDRYLL